MFCSCLLWHLACPLHLYSCVVLSDNFMFPLGTPGALVKMKGSRCVSSGLAQLAFWNGGSSIVGRVWPVCGRQSQQWENLWKETFRKRKCVFSGEPSPGGCFVGKKPPPWAERDVSIARETPSRWHKWRMQRHDFPATLALIQCLQTMLSLLNKLADETSFCFSKLCF